MADRPLESRAPCALTVVVVNWNAGERLAACARSIEDASPPVDVETIVVDNGSVDGSLDPLDGLDGVTVLRLGENRGFAAACNAGLDRARGRHVLFLNPDARIRPGALDAVCRGLDESPDIGVLGGALVDAAGQLERSVGRFPGPGRMIADVIARLAGRPPGLDAGQLRVPTDVDWVTGAFLALSASARRAGVRFDEGYPLYVEDVDLCRLAHERGLRVVFVPEVWAEHARGGTAPGGDRVRLRRLGELRYLRKWGGASSWPLVAMYALLSRAWESGAAMLPDAPADR